MKTQLKEVSPTQREIKIEIEPEVVRDSYNKISQKYARMAQIPGFRKGFAPVDVVRARYQEDIQNEVLRDLLPDRVSEAIKEHNLSPLGEPHLHLEDSENVKANGTVPLSLHVHVEVMPEIETPKYKGLEASRRVRPVNDDELEQIIDERLKAGATFVPVSRKSKTGDTVIVDLVGTFLDRAEEEPIKAEDLEIKIGDENIEKSFTENLAGLVDDEEKTFTVEYPGDFTSPGLAGRQVEYTARIKSVGVVEIPKADDEWARSLEEGFESMKDLRRKLRDDLEFVAKSEADNLVRDELVRKLIEAHEFEVPNTLIDIQARNLLNNFAQDLARQGMDLQKLGKEFIQNTFEQLRGQGERDVRGAMLLEKVAELEKIEISGEEIAEEIERMANYYRVSAEDIRTQLSKQGGENSISDRLRSRKAVEALVDKARIKEEKWVDPVQAAAEASEKPKPAKKASKKKA